MQLSLELLAPARDKRIGIAAIDCGADAVYIAGPAYGAREAAGNSFADIRELCSYAHRFGARIYLVLNTILYDHELKDAERHLREAWLAGCDAVIVQDLAVLQLERPPIPLHASTQTDIRTPEQARFLEALGFERLILARELSLAQIREIRQSVCCELETFVHGALCVSYSGSCYLSQYLSGRSSNRGSCIQACRGRYDLEDENGRILVRNKPLLSLKDFAADRQLDRLAAAGVCSFKIEGRLKNESYVKNIVRHYRIALDRLIDTNPDFRRASWGRVTGGFTPNPGYTFSRGHTSFFLEGKRGPWNSGETGKSLGEPVGTVSSLRSQGNLLSFRTDGPTLGNGDGLCFITPSGEAAGIRVERCEGGTVFTRRVPGLQNGTRLYRNYNRGFERILERQMPERLIEVSVSARSAVSEDGSCSLRLTARSEDGRTASVCLEGIAETAKSPDARRRLLSQLEKKNAPYRFCAGPDDLPVIPFLPVSRINEARRSLAASLDAQIVPPPDSRSFRPVPYRPDLSGLQTLCRPAWESQARPNLNVSNRLAADIYRQCGLEPEPAYELSPAPDAELMRCKYCLRHELGRCANGRQPRPWYLINHGYRLRLEFDCERCEMIVRAPGKS